ncbi:ABC transporter ATP-binding protein [Sulfitobacter geojensis]|uniref:ABC transporter ATP-binding protein n=1 Tax=Sulfitobacter geojensis TaxID=1342299 RepID=A0AAE2VVP5_9RHOB|nr:ABC transporter ATP-binding protein [Sulfitobacter geojensis]MBM1688281.1 ABC transporter ATP-binding protein [Sulfitobacter geojensis]MBM1692348.1 ABC transporter ATP-binding protein [Sulfitobacter geojensis]MBM1704514.1 ABC transporter ATP-binding protein [Sulfitobacter geojensis]MBM1708572.1 ABC transporter ATP-binding protein [Sulfitobacter geojensis]MBM1712637.1 ABC transporter ATP-binding protein [Sulfitobacter geojensis]
MNILETKGLTKVYGGISANADVDFALPTGKITALIGPNGAGKSTFVGMVSGRTPATRGQVLFEGRDISALPAHKRIQLGIAYTFQITSIFPRLSVHENVAIAARRLFGKQPTVLASKIAAALGKVDIADRADQIAGDLSYGHQRLLEIAMGLVQEPRVFILDEPTQGLAEAEVAGFIALIKSLAGETTILLIEHNMTVVMGAADWITVLDQGMVLANGTPEEISQNGAVQAAYLGKTDA